MFEATGSFLAIWSVGESAEIQLYCLLPSNAPQRKNPTPTTRRTPKMLFRRMQEIRIDFLWQRVVPSVSRERKSPGSEEEGCSKAREQGKRTRVFQRASQYVYISQIISRYTPSTTGALRRDDRERKPATCAAPRRTRKEETEGKRIIAYGM